MVFFALSNVPPGNEKLAGEILSGLPSVLDRYETAFKKSDGRWYQDEYVEVVGIRLAMWSLLRPELFARVIGPPNSFSASGRSEDSAASHQLTLLLKSAQDKSKDSVLLSARELAQSERLKPVARARLQTLLARYD